MSRRTKSTPKKRRTSTARTRSVDWKPKFIDSLRECGNIGAACKVAKIGRQTYYQHKAKDAVFSAQVVEALEDAGDVLEQEAWRRAVQGVEKPVFGSLGPKMGSGVVGAVQEYSDTLLIFLLKGNKPDKFRERHIVETWQDRVIALLRERKVTPSEVISELGADVATDLIIAAGLSGGEGGETRTAGGDSDAAAAVG